MGKDKAAKQIKVLKQFQKNVNEGCMYVADMDLEKFFDTVCQNKLIEALSRTIKDGRVISLIRRLQVFGARHCSDCIQF